MAAFLNLLMSFLIYSLDGINGKTINLKVDTDDIANLFNRLLGSDLVKNLAQHILRRAVGPQIIYSNPYHPEDKFILEELAKSNNLEKKYNLMSRNLSKDILDKENENFADGHISEDVLTDNGVDSLEVLKINMLDEQTVFKTQNDSLTLISGNKAKNVLPNLNKDSDKIYTRSDNTKIKSLLRRFIVKRNKNGD